MKDYPDTPPQIEDGEVIVIRAPRWDTGDFDEELKQGGRRANDVIDSTSKAIVSGVDPKTPEGAKQQFDVELRESLLEIERLRKNSFSQFSHLPYIEAVNIPIGAYIELQFGNKTSGESIVTDTYYRLSGFVDNISESDSNILVLRVRIERRNSSGKTDESGYIAVKFLLRVGPLGAGWKEQKRKNSGKRKIRASVRSDEVIIQNQGIFSTPEELMEFRALLSTMPTEVLLTDIIIYSSESSKGLASKILGRFGRLLGR